MHFLLTSFKTIERHERRLLLLRVRADGFPELFIRADDVEHIVANLKCKPERLSELFCALTAAGIEPKRLRLVCPRPASAPSLVLVEGRRGGRPGLTVEPPLLLRDADGADSAELRRIYRR